MNHSIKYFESLINSSGVAGKTAYITDPIGNGLRLRITPKGSKSWVLTYKAKVDGVYRSKSMGLGRYPAIGIKDARNTVAKIKLLRSAEGSDPLIEKRKRQKQAEQAFRDAMTVDNLFESCYEQKISKRKKGSDDYRKYMKDISPFIGAKRVVDVEARDIHAINDHVLKRGNRIARMTFSLMRTIFRYGTSRSLIKYDPTYGIDLREVGQAEKPRERYLSEKELHELSNQLMHLDRRTMLAAMLQLSTGMRIGEVCKAKWSDIHDGYIYIPESNSKNGSEHQIWLSRFSHEILDQLSSLNRTNEHLIPNYSGKTPEYDSTLIATNIRKAQKDGVLVVGRSRFTPHDLRRTFGTTLSTLGFSDDVIHKCLNHKSTSLLTRTYNQNKRLQEMKDAWTSMGEYLGEIFDIGQN